MLMKKVFYSKSSKKIITIKKGFLDKNKELINQARKWNKLYNKQPKRKYCKACEKPLTKKIFTSHFANYTICKFCGHFNGLNKDTKKFNELLYKKDGGQKFSKFYLQDYKARVEHISKPKLEFLKKIIKGKKEILELGSGAGHFLKACELNSIKATGYDVNPSMVKLGNKMLKKNKIKQFNIDDIYNMVLSCEKDIITILGVIEHLEFPNLIFENFKKSKAKYMFFAVPMISLTVFLEHCFQNTFPRAMGGVHNHLYSEKSLNYIFKKNKLKIIGEWWFGSDMMDLMRSILINSNPTNKLEYKKNLDSCFISIIDDLQSILDKKKLCGDVHMVITK